VAATVRLTGRDAPVALAGVGGFGAAVARTLAATWPAARIVAPGDLAAAARGVQAAVVALWRPSPTLTDDIDTIMFGYAIPWLPVVLEHPHLIVGPWIVPPGGPCLRCYEQRRRQHEPATSLMSALHTAYDADPALGPGGHLPHQARIAAGLADAVLRQGLAGAPAAAGRVTVSHLVTGALATHRAVGVHGCTRCGTAAVGSALSGTVSRFATRSAMPAGSPVPAGVPVAAGGGRRD
jgi:bacteriocin biosynthesis cyclodehydratase domain-containing protein